MPNLLANENSLYLRQHADNPVDWHPWSEAAFALAKEKDLPVIVSIGYSACHWCHVMAHESFEDEYIAGIMNRHFVCIKVDREEHPEVDRIYMDAVQMLNGQGGWPLNVFCLPDGRPFAGGTYFPPDENRGHAMVPWPQLLMRVADFYKREKKDLEENAEAILGNLAASNQPLQTQGDGLDPGELPGVVERILENFDPSYGGFGSAPKFPPPMMMDFLFAMRGTGAVELKKPALAKKIDEAINTTLTGMAHGGLFDQIGGGFSRYCVDSHWHIPHFEKMLYDNALLLRAYATAYSRYPKPLYRAVVQETIAWLEREMAHSTGGFSAALDADSEGEEGRYYLWTPKEVEAHLGTELGARFCEAYGISEEGNFEETGRSHAILLEPEFEKRESLGEARTLLLTEREKRVPPGKDEKRILAWNAYAVSGFARAGRIFGEKAWFLRAVETAEWIWESGRLEDNLLGHLIYEAKAEGVGILEDYASVAEAFLEIASGIELFTPGKSGLWVDRAEALLKEISEQFVDSRAVGYFNTGSRHQGLVHRQKDWLDQATPSGNSSLLHCFVLLDALRPEARYGEEAEKMRVGYPGLAERAPAAIPHALEALVHRAMGVVVIHFHPENDREALAAALRTRPWRAVMILPSEEIPEGTWQICVGTQCLAPVESLSELVEMI